jgi:hypothetical protein
MNPTLLLQLQQLWSDPSAQYALVGASASTIGDYILNEMPIAISEGDWSAQHTLAAIASSVEATEERARILNQLLVMPGHSAHQEVTFEIQKTRSPSSVPFIRRMLESEFADLAYTCSEPQTIAKWFSHALAKIGTPEALAMIHEFSRSSNTGIAAEMTYRLDRLAGRE